MKELSYYLDYEQPTKYIVETEDYSDEYETPVLTAGQSFILGYTDEKDGIFYADKEPVIIFDDFTTSIQYVDFPFKVKSSALKILHAKNGFNIKFLYYVMKNIKFNADVHKRYWISTYSKIKIKDFTKEEQDEIAKKLNTISDSIVLKEKLIKKYDNLIDAVFNKRFSNNTDVSKMILPKVCEDIFAGGDVPKNNLSKNKTEEYNIPIFTNGETNNGLYGYTDIPKVEKDALTISARGTIGFMAVRKAPFYPAIRLITVIPDTKQIRINYLKYALRGLIKSNGTSIPQLTTPKVKKFIIPIPKMEEQEKFEDFVNKINSVIGNISKEIIQLRQLLNVKVEEYTK